MTSPDDETKGSESPLIGFADLGLPEPLLTTLSEVGYEAPSPIQARAIPELLAGRDLIGQAQTGTGKTAAFALPLLARLGPKGKNPRLLVLTPTRELAIQVSEALRRYGARIPGFHVLPVYGGTGYHGQLRGLARGVQAVVGTPGRVIDLMKRGALALDDLQALVLDEADEMLRMGFIDDVRFVLDQSPEGRQLALFSATMPAEIAAIADRHLNDPARISTEVSTRTAATIHQRYWIVAGLHKLDALTRLLEVEAYEAMIIFVRTKTATMELAERLDARGHAAEALNGDMPQEARERAMERIRNGKLDILVATDVAARGLDVDRISHVINFDVPYDVEAYVHRIGRTGRAGRKGEAVLFVAPRERRMLKAIERATGATIEALALPSAAEVNLKRIERFKAAIDRRREQGGLETYLELMAEYQREREISGLDLAATLAALVQGESPLLLDVAKERAAEARQREAEARQREAERPRRGADAPGHHHERMEAGGDSRRPRRQEEGPEQGMRRYRIDVGRKDGVRPGNIVGAVANEGDIEARHIGRIVIMEHFCTIDLPERLPHAILDRIARARVCGRPLRLRPDRPPRPGGGHPGGREQGRPGGWRDDRPRPRRHGPR